MNLRFFINFNL